MSSMSTASRVMEDSITEAGCVKLNVGARFNTTTSTTISSVSNSSSTTRTFTLHDPLFDQFHCVSSQVLDDIDEACCDSISNRQSTSPPSISKL